MTTRNAVMLPPAAPASSDDMYSALLDGLRAAEKTRAASVTATWDSILQTATPTVRPARTAK